MTRNLTVEERSLVATVRGEGYSMRKIAKKLNIISLCAVQNIVRKKKKETGSVKDITRLCRPCITTNHEDSALVRLSLSD